MEQEITKTITTESGENEFQVRLLKDDGVGLLTTKNGENYLILDSLDYWYDLIQNEYPKKKKCNCKNEWFYVQFTYIPRLATDDIREIRVVTNCTVCSKISNPISIDIDYSPTRELIENPITFCERPNIKYHFSELTSYWSDEDLKEFLRFIFLDLKVNAYCWFFKKTENKRCFEKVSFEKAIQIITLNHGYLSFYFSVTEVDESKFIKLTDDNGVYLKDELWRKNEMIRLSSPFSIWGYGLLYYINFCNQYLDKGIVKDKSEQFEGTTSQLINWLKDTFVTKRGTNCFDGKEAYDKFMDKRNAKK